MSNPNQKLNKFSEKNVFLAFMNVVNIKGVRNVILLRNVWIFEVYLFKVFGLIFVEDVFVVND